MFRIPRMSLAEAKAEATRRWRVHGGWAIQTQDYTSTCRVGIRVPTNKGTERLTLGVGGTFERAFDAAERKLARERDRLMKPQPRRPRPSPPGRLPQEEMEL